MCPSTSVDSNNDSQAQELDDKVQALLCDLKAELGNELCDGVSDATLCKFLYWKQDVQRASERFRSFVEWRKENKFAYDGEKPLKMSCDPMLETMLCNEILVLPDDLKDKNGNAVMIGRLRNNDQSDGRTPQDIVRMMLYAMDRLLERRHVKENGVVVFHDLTGVSRSNLNVAAAKLIVAAIFGHMPIRINGFYIYKAPKFFKLIFSVVTSMVLNRKLRQRFHFIDDMEELYSVIDKDSLLKEYGGKLEFNTKDWVENQKEREQSSTTQMESLTDCVPTTKF
jgi:hypothetical protein